MTSGTWVGHKVTEEKHGFPVSFQKESLELSKKYNTLYIIALKKQSEHVFQAIFVHNGVEKVIADSSQTDHLTQYLSSDPRANIYI